jgi:hypothetical protein
MLWSAVPIVIQVKSQTAFGPGMVPACPPGSRPIDCRVPPRLLSRPGRATQGTASISSV